MTRKHLPFNQCSAFQLPFPRTAYHSHLLNQDGSRGWLDMDLIRSLPEGLKEQVKKQQEQDGIEVTDFAGLLQ